MVEQDCRAGWRQSAELHRYSGAVAGHQGMPWATEGFPLPVHPGLMSCQVLLQNAELQLAQNWACHRGPLALGENLVSATPSWPSPFKLCFVLATFLEEEALMVLQLFWM